MHQAHSHGQRIHLAAVAIALTAAVVNAGTVRADVDSTLRTARIEVALRLALLEHFGLDGGRVGIDVHGDTVTLSGVVKEKPTQELSEEVALAVDGVKQVDNDITLATAESGSEEPAAKAVDKAEKEVGDAVLESRVKLNLLDKIGLQAMKLEIEASGGVVSLRGTVASGEHRDIALRTARRTKGVKKVIDLIKVRD
jgi:hyperosmotically inducible protein